ncbi:MAG: hypothetical protein QF462_01990, partial [Myxococcota bacterium]|nr:hypothetical protein [Myxococcota bacterium]
AAAKLVRQELAGGATEYGFDSIARQCLDLGEVFWSGLALLLDVFDGRFRTSFDGRVGNASGPLIRFLDRCFAEMRDAITRSRIVYEGRERPEEQRSLLGSLGVSREALRNRSRHSEWRDLIARLQRIAGEVEGVL